MKSRILMGLVVFALLASGCKRGAQTNSNSSNSTAGQNGSPGGVAEARALLAKGKQLYQSDQDSEAAEAFKQALQLDPELAEAHFRLGLAYDALNKQEQAEGEYKKAIESFKKYLDKNPDDAEAHYDLAQTFAGLHQYSDAIREYRQATKLKNNDPDIFYDLGTAHMKLAQYDEAASAFSKSLDIDPDNYRAADALEEAREGVQRIRAGRKHQEDLLKKQKEDELKKAGEAVPGTASKPTPGEGSE